MISYGDDGDARLASDDDLLLVVFGQFANPVRDRRMQVVVATDVLLRCTVTYTLYVTSVPFD